MRTAAVLLSLVLAGVASGAAFADVLPPVPTVPSVTVPTPVAVPSVPAPSVPSVSAPSVSAPSAPAPAPSVPSVHVSTPTVRTSAPTAQQPVPSVSVTGGPSVGSGGGGSTSGSGDGGSGSPGSGGGSSAGSGYAASGGSYGSASTGASSRPDARAGVTAIARLRASRPWIATSGPTAQRQTTLNFRLRKRARVVFTVTQLAPACQVEGQFVVNGRRGLNRITFDGRIHDRQLAPGTYRIAARVAGGATVLRVILVIVDAAPSPTELERARHADVCAAARALAANATLASGGAAGSTGSGASEHAGVSAELAANAASDDSTQGGDHTTATRFISGRDSAGATHAIALAAVALAALLLSLASLPERLLVGGRAGAAVARHRLELVFAAFGALVAALLAAALT